MNFVRSAMAPDTIVAAVAANATWNTKKTVGVSVPYENEPSLRNQSPLPMNLPIPSVEPL